MCIQRIGVSPTEPISFSLDYSSARIYTSSRGRGRFIDVGSYIRVRNGDGPTTPLLVAPIEDLAQKPTISAHELDKHLPSVQATTRPRLSDDIHQQDALRCGPQDVKVGIAHEFLTLEPAVDLETRCSKSKQDVKAEAEEEAIVSSAPSPQLHAIETGTAQSKSRSASTLR